VDIVDNIARPAAAAAVLFLDHDGQVLIVEPTYKPRWEIPGGEVEKGETPREACTRVLHHQLRLDLPPGPLLVVDWAPLVREERVRFVFDGGTLTEAQLDRIELAPDVLTSWAFLSPDELFVMMEPRSVRRVLAAIDTRRTGVPAYLESGLPAD
jgi:ADP-ribose pyrophosphatase YjhB (NUDIX family)